MDESNDSTQHHIVLLVFTQLIGIQIKILLLFIFIRFKVLTKSPPKHPTLCERTGLKFIPLFTPLRHSLHSPTTGTCITPVSTPYYKVQCDESISESENDYTALEGSILYHNTSSHQKSLLMMR